MSKYNPYSNRNDLNIKIDEEINQLLNLSVKARIAAEEELNSKETGAKDMAYILTNLLNTQKGIWELILRNDKDLYYYGLRGVPDNLKNKDAPQGDLFEDHYVLDSGSGQLVKTHQKVSNNSKNASTEDIVVFESMEVKQWMKKTF